MNTRIRRIKEHACRRCGETITNNRSEFCDECYPKYIELRDLYRVARRFPVMTRKCPVCNNVFYTKRSGRIYCSDECQYAVEKERQRVRSARRRLGIKGSTVFKCTCSVCNKEFEAGSIQAKFCSETCRAMSVKKKVHRCRRCGVEIDNRIGYCDKCRDEIKEERRAKKEEDHAMARRASAIVRQLSILQEHPEVERPLTGGGHMVPDEVWTECHLQRVALGKFKCLRCGNEFVESGYKGFRDFLYQARQRNVCPYCSDYPYGFSRVSVPELEIQKLFPEFSIAHWHPDWMEGKEIDLYAPEYNVALEYDGIKWHSGVTKADRRQYAAKHIEKTDLCEKHGIQLIHLFETEWLNSRDCVIDKLSAIFHRPMERYMARKCYTEVVESGTTEFNKCRDEVVAFLNRNHIQGAGTSGSCRVMLRDKATGELRAVCCFQNRHGRSKATEEEWDLCRYATALGTTVAGGITKCISAFKGAHPECKVLTSLADRRWTSTLRSAYSSSGFEWDGEPAHSDYFYVVKRDGRPRLVNKSSYQLKFIDREFPETFVEGADNTEWARMERAGVPYIYDCGKLKYVMKFD